MFGMYLVDQNGRVLTAIYKKNAKMAHSNSDMVGFTGLEPVTSAM